VRQKCILLRLVESMHLIDKHERAAGLMLLREYNRIADVLNTPEHRRNRHEFETKRIGQQPRKRCLTHPRWPPQNHRMGTPAVNRKSERSTLAKQMVLAKDGGHGPRTHTLGQGLLRLIWE
jgi:hypothetical protein